MENIRISFSPYGVCWIYLIISSIIFILVNRSQDQYHYHYKKIKILLPKIYEYQKSLSIKKKFNFNSFFPKHIKSLYSEHIETYHRVPYSIFMLFKNIYMILVSKSIWKNEKISFSIQTRKYYFFHSLTDFLHVLFFLLILYYFIYF